MTATNAQWKGCKIVAIGKEHLIAEVNGTEKVFCILQLRFRKKASEAEGKREDAIQALASFAITYQDASEMHDAIAAGKIPGIKLAD